jgi:predicted alpha/beta hydrolase family esterase
MNSNCIIIHGCPTDVEKAMDPETRTYDKHWIPWVKKALVAKDLPTETPLMPTPWDPDYEKFKTEFEKLPINEQTILIGHSCGNTFLVRWLGESKQRIAKLIMVAPWKLSESESAAKKAFYHYRIDETIKDRISEIIMFTSDNEADDGKAGLLMYHEALGGEVINLDNHGHYTLGDMGTEEFPELIKIVMR